MMCGCAAKYRTAIAPIGVAFALVLWLGNAAYLYLSVSFIQMIKALMPMAVCPLALLCSSIYLSHTHPPIRTYHTYMLPVLIRKVGLYRGTMKVAISACFSISSYSSGCNSGRRDSHGAGDVEPQSTSSRFPGPQRGGLNSRAERSYSPRF